ncbi:MAG: GNAT family N-acetyltransferase [Gemmatimonadota bacterium]|nr:GNAT family N-acetyltransferase [Gemmatimonadota bacterium]
MPELSIRAASSDDAGALASLLGELGYPSEADRVRARLARVLGAGGQRATDCVFVAADARTADVLGLLSLHRFAGLHDDADVALITGLVVAERARGLGVGRQLVDSAVDTARRWGCTRLMVTTHVRRAGAHAFYESIGFELTGRRYVLAL